ncbi:MAG: T9SS type A sorting domain-containing protein [Bacteroidota bacterium]
MAIPSGGDNVVFVGFEAPVSNQNVDRQRLPLSVFPNPISDQSVIEFNLPQNQYLELAIYDGQGKLVKQLLEGMQMAGEHRVLLTGLDLSTGMYHCRLMGMDGVEGELKLLVVD